MCICLFSRVSVSLVEGKIRKEVKQNGKNKTFAYPVGSAMNAWFLTVVLPWLTCYSVMPSHSNQLHNGTSG